MPPAGKVAIQFEVNSSSFSSGMDKVTKQVKQFQGATADASHSSVSNINQISGSLRLLENVQSTNLRALERWVSQSKIASQVFAAAFPLVGAVAAASMLSRLGSEAAAAIKKFQEMPKAITQGFNAMHLATASATDGLRLTNDELQRSIDKLQGKSDTKNILAIQLDEARIKADELAKSLEHDADSVKKLLADNKLGSLSVMVGKGDTANVSGSVSSFEDQFKDLGFKAQDARRSGNTGQADDLQKQLQEKLKAALKWADNYQKFFDSPFALGDNSANKAIVGGFKSSVYDRMDASSQQDRNGDLVGQQKAAQDAHAAAEKAAEARKREAEEMAKGWATSLELAKQADTLARDMASFASESNNDFFKSAGVSSDGNAQLTQAGKATNDWITSLRAGFDAVNANKTAIAENSIQMAVATGQMTRQDAALASAALNTDTYTASLAKLKALRDSINSNTHLSDQEKQAQLNNNSTAQGNLTANYQMQQAAYQQTANPANSSALVGAKQALQDFTDASTDAAKQMNELVTSTLQSLNSTLLSKNPDFKAFGAGVFGNIAKSALNMAEGDLFKALGIKDPNSKLGTQSNPMIVQFANGSGSSGGLGSIFSKLSGSNGSSSSSSGSSGGIFGSLKSLFGNSSGTPWSFNPDDANSGTGINPLSSGSQKSFLWDQLLPRITNGLSFGGGDSGSGGGGDSDSGGPSGLGSLSEMIIPFLATGGPIDGPAIVGENGPELYVPNSSGSIVPNHKLGKSGVGGGGDVHFHPGAIDARGAGDPAQVNAAVQRGIMQAAPHIMAGAVQMGKQQQQRRPSSFR